MQLFFHQHKILLPLSQVAPQHSSIPECSFRMFGLRKSEQEILLDCYRQMSGPFTTYVAFVIIRKKRLLMVQLQRFQVDIPLAEDQQVRGRELDLYMQHFWDTNIWNTALGSLIWEALLTQLANCWLHLPPTEDPAIWCNPTD